MWRPRLERDRRFYRFAAEIGELEPFRGMPEEIVRTFALGLLERIWMMGYERGDEYLGAASDVIDVAGWPFEPMGLINALMNCGATECVAGFIDEIVDDNGHHAGRYFITDLWRYAPPWALRIRRGRLRKRGDRRRPSDWRIVRVRILERDSYVCRYCGAAADSVDHVVPRRKGGSHDDDNLVAACRMCNSRKQHRTPDEAGMQLDRRTV
jgi:HNH endonuclease